MAIKKMIGKKEIEVEGEDIYLKLTALNEAYNAVMKDWHGQECGTFRFDHILIGLNMLFDDVLTELDQAFLDGDMERTKVEKAEAVVAAIDALSRTPHEEKEV
jgi:hypothetical protein